MSKLWVRCLKCKNREEIANIGLRQLYLSFKCNRFYLSKVWYCGKCYRDGEKGDLKLFKGNTQIDVIYKWELIQRGLMINGHNKKDDKYGT